MKIYSSWNGESKELDATAYIQQNFLKISMEVETDNSESDTLIVKAKKDSESGRPILYYVYRNFFKNKEDNNCSFEGTAILKLDHSSLNCLKGNYFTSAGSSGHFELVKAQ